MSTFETRIEEVGGVPMTVFADRLHSLSEILTDARTHGHSTFIAYGEQRITFEGFVDDSYRTSAGLGRLGVVQGDRVAILSENRPEWCLTFWGTVALGGIAVGLNGWWTASEVLHGLTDSQARVLVVDGLRLDRVGAALEEAPDLETIVIIDPPVDGRLPVFHGRRVVTFQAVLGDQPAIAPDVHIAEDDPAVILYTSGTTGEAKGALTSHRNLIANVQNTLSTSVYGSRSGSGAQQARAQPVALFTSPLFHVSGCHSTLVTGLHAGLRLVMMPGRFDAEAALRLIESERVTTWATVPTLVHRLCTHPSRDDFDLTSVRSVAYGGSPSGSEMQRLVRETFPSLRGGGSNVYGLTESSSAATVLSAEDALARPTSVGRPAPTVAVRIVDELGSELGPGEVGEIELRGPTIMSGYWGRPEATAAALRDGWLRTGDVGHLDPDGFLFVSDRKKDLIIRGGENIATAEVENRLVEHLDVLEAAVFGVPDADLGERVKAVVCIKAGAAASPTSLRAWVGLELASFKVPSEIDVRYEPLPRNASGKILKNDLR